MIKSHFDEGGPAADPLEPASGVLSAYARAGLADGIARPKVAINMRAAEHEKGGQQRMMAEIAARLPWLEQISSPYRGAAGHAWEQFVLPVLARGRMLWSPSTSGPVLYGHQIVTIHDVGCLDVPELYPRAFQRTYRAILPLLARRARHVVTVSDFSRRRIIDLFGLREDKVSVIANGVSDVFGPQSDGAVAAAKARHGIKDRFVLVQASANPRKNLAGVIEAWRRLGPRLPADVELVVFGQETLMATGSVRPEWTGVAQARSLGALPDSDMAALMAGADCFVFPSLYEGFGLPVVEAMRCGAAVLTGNSSALPEVAGDAALLVDTRSLDAIAEGLMTLLSTPDLRLCLKGRGSARAAMFNWDVAARRYGALFARLA
jgi:glycosyltransferase involved in cell wall biosynthesis